MSDQNPYRIKKVKDIPLSAKHHEMSAELAMRMAVLVQAQRDLAYLMYYMQDADHPYSKDKKAWKKADNANMAALEATTQVADTYNKKATS